MLNKKILCFSALSGLLFGPTFGAHNSVEQQPNEQIAGTHIANSNYQSIRKEIEDIERETKIKANKSDSIHGHKISHTKKKEILHKIRNLMHKLRTSTDAEGAELLKTLEILEHKVSSLHSHFRHNAYPPKKPKSK